MESALRTVAVLLRTAKLGVGSAMILAALCVICVSLFLWVTGSMVKKQGNSRGGLVG